MYFDYVGMKDDRLYGIINVNCDEKGFNKDDRNIKIIKFWGTSEKISVKTEISDYWAITSIIERKENSGYDGLVSDMVKGYSILSDSIQNKLSKKYIWEKLKE
jgi:hypothetical protein